MGVLRSSFVSPGNRESVMVLARADDLPKADLVQADGLKFASPTQ